MDTQERIEDFLAQSRFAVVGASTNRSKYGNRCLRCYQQAERNVVAVNPRETEVEGAASYPSLSEIPESPDAVSVITPPAVSLRVLDEAASLGIRHVWFQPGAEDEAVLARAEQLGLEVIAGGPCVLVVLGFRE